MQKLYIALIVAIVLTQAYAQTCPAGQYNNNGTCTNCPSGSATCTAVNSFQSCSTSGWFQLNLSNSSNVVCSRCNQTSTLTCNSGIQALTCNTGYQLISDACVQCSINPLASCQTTCSTSGFYTLNGQCLSCQNSTSACASECLTQGFFTQGTTCQRCAPGATACVSATLSTACATGSYLGAGGVCTRCPAGQATCSVSPVALSCVSGYYLSATNTCVLCATSTTAACNSQCLAFGFFSTGNTCNKCSASSTAACLSNCQDFGFLTVGTTCVACTDANALKCQNVDASNLATSCKSGYFLDKSGACTLCSNTNAQITTCNASPIADTCKAGYVLQQTTCVACANPQGACFVNGLGGSPTLDCTQNGFYTSGVVGVNASCVACAKGARVCTSLTNSSACYSGFVLQGTTCVENLPGVASVAAPVSTSPCKTGFYLSGTVCLTCGANMATCSDFNTALSCVAGYTLFQSQCFQCPAGTLVNGCTVPIHVECNSGYFLKNGQCTACTAGYAACLNEQANKAIGCANNQYLKSDGTCGTCTSGARQCNADSAQDLVCQDGYWAGPPYASACSNTVSDLTPNNEASLLGQVFVGTAKAQVCKAGFFLKTVTTSSTCVQCTNSVTGAKSCQSETALKDCQENYVLINNYCEPCGGNGKTCITNDYSIQATSCATGYYLSSAITCSSCKTSTALKASDGTSALLNQDKIASCSITSTAYTTITSITCTTGYQPARSDNSGSTTAATALTSNIAGCWPCFQSSDSANADKYSTCTLTSTVSGSTLTVTTTVPICATGSYLSSATTCSSCKTNSALKSSDGTTGLINQDKIVTCGITGTVYTTITQITCGSGYQPVDLRQGQTTSNGNSKISYIAGCAPCFVSGESANAAKYTSCTLTTSITNGKLFVLTSAVACATGFYRTSDTVCSDCTTNTALKASDGSSTILNQAQIATCDITGTTYTTITSITCKTGYQPLATTAGSNTQNNNALTANIKGCAPCFTNAEAANFAGYASCTTTKDTGVASAVVCADGFFKTTDTVCSNCKTYTALRQHDGNTVIVNQDKIATCGITGSDATTITSITCQTGYQPQATTAGTDTTTNAALTANIMGCAPCFPTGQAANAARYASCTITKQTGAASVVVCAAGFYRTSDTECSDCASNTALKASDGSSTILNQAQIASCTITGTAYTVITSITCKTGYQPQATTAGTDSTTNAALTSNIMGCAPCFPTAESANFARYASCTITKQTGAASAVVCATGFYRTSDTVCSDCASNTALKASDGTSTILNQAQIASCAITSTAYTTITSITCKAGYQPVRSDNTGSTTANTALTSNIAGCQPCFDSSDSANAARYATCTQTSNIIPGTGTFAATAVACDTGFYRSSDTVCSDCTTNTALKQSDASSALLNQGQIATCAITTTAYTTITSITCKTGYQPQATTAGANTADNTALTANIMGCAPCFTNAEAANSARYASCTITKQTGAASAVVCAAGFYRTSDTVCSDCSSNTALKQSDGTSALLNQGQIATCAISGTTYTTITSITCKAGYQPVRSDNAGTTSGNSALTSNIAGCFPCFPTGDSSFAANYATCTVTSTVSGSTLSAVATSPVCVSTNGATYSFSLGNHHCRLCNPGSDVVYTQCSGSFAKTACQSGYFLKNGACVTCYRSNSGTPSIYADCTNELQNKAKACVAGYVLVTYGVGDNLVSDCVSCGGAAGSAKTCSTAIGYAITSGCQTGYALDNGLCWACPGNATVCTTRVHQDCAEGYFLNTDVLVCQQCTGTGAARCSAAATTTQCKTVGFRRSSNAGVTPVTCEACSNSYAKTCDAAAATHTACVDGAYLVGSTCTQCPNAASVATCTSAGAADTCKVGYNKIGTACVALANGVKTTTATTSANAVLAGYASDCLPGFFLKASNCFPCGRNVATCDDISTPKSCNTGYSLVGGQCAVCPYGASSCSATNVALSCRTGYYLKNGQCIQCSSTLADGVVLACAETMFATSCVSGFTAIKGVCVQCPAGASQCSDANTITNCADGYYQETVGGKVQCTACTAGAATCSGANAHTNCLTGWSKVGTATTCAQCTATGAAQCTTALNAVSGSSCITGYSYIAASTSCVKCPENAVACSSEIYATQCVNGYTAYAGRCILCLPGTLTCNAPVQGDCLSGYGKDATTQLCVACASSSSACNDACKTRGFYTAGSGSAQSCQACGTGALSCSATGATTCDSANGYQPSPVNNACVPCPSGALTCTAAGVATDCLAGYIKNTAGSCVQCSVGATACTSLNIASACLPGYFLNEKGKCIVCTDSNSQTCSIKGSALTCTLGFYPINGVCQSCTSTTNACVPACLNLGFFTKNTTVVVNNTNVIQPSCASCDTNAASCLDNTVAYSCFPGSYLNDKAKCVTCTGSNSARCALGVNKVATTDSCNPGFFNDLNGNCAACPANFATCTNATFGLTCQPGFYYVNNSTCSQCPPSAATCTSPNTAQSCNPGFYATPVQGFDVTCTPCPGTNNMVTCYNAQYATSCKPGFNAVNGTCVGCPANAVNCLGSIVLTCNSGFFLANNTCNACGVGAATCVSNTTAISCLPGYGLLATQNCTKCPLGVAQCNFNSISQCYAGFVSPSAGVCQCPTGFAPTADQTACGACPSNCNVCSSPQQCTTCKSGFTLQSSGSCALVCPSGQYVSNTTSGSTSNSSTTGNNTATTGNNTANVSTNASSNTSSTSSNVSTNTSSKRMLQSCQTCPASCGNCTSASVCQSCQNGFTLRQSDSTCQPNFAGKLSFGNLFMMIAIFLGFSLIIKQ